MKFELKEYHIPSSIGERCLESTTIAYTIFMEYLLKLSSDENLKYDKDFYLHYYARIKNALDGKSVGDDLN